MSWLRTLISLNDFPTRSGPGGGAGDGSPGPSNTDDQVATLFTDKPSRKKKKQKIRNSLAVEGRPYQWTYV